MILHKFMGISESSLCKIRLDIFSSDVQKTLAHADALARVFGAYGGKRANIVSCKEFSEVPICLDKGNLIKKETQEDIFLCLTDYFRALSIR